MRTIATRLSVQFIEQLSTISFTASVPQLRTIAAASMLSLTTAIGAQSGPPAAAHTPGAVPAARKPFLPTPSAEQCSAFSGNSASVNAQGWLSRAAAAILPENTTGKVLRIRSYNDQMLWEQSDRMYEPFIPNMQALVRWFNPATGVEGRQPTDRPAGSAVSTLLSTPTAVFATRDTATLPLPQMFPFTEPERQLNPWAVLISWRQSSDVRVVARCVMRDYPRVVLSRSGAYGDEHLYLDEFSAVPVQVSRTEPHYLWGQVRADYQWATWAAVPGGGSFPNASHRLFDGHVYGRQANPSVQLIPADSAPKLTVPANGEPMSTAPATFPNPDTVRVSANTFLLVNRAYTNVVTLQRDTVFVLDATSNEARSRADSAWIQKLFPGRHPIVLVVTDLAWPHISGVRFWAANRTPIVTHTLSTAFLQSVVDRQWTLQPDLLEKQRSGKRTVLVMRTVRDSMRLAGGALVVHAIRGVASEGAVLVSIPGEKFVWAGDYVQQVNRPTQYAGEVVRTLSLLGITPDRIAAQHLPLTNFDVVAKVNRGNATVPSGSIFP